MKRTTLTGERRLFEVPAGIHRWMRIVSAFMTISLAVVPSAGVPTSAQSVFDFQSVYALAQALAARPYQAPAEVPAPLQHLTYEQYQQVRFKPDRSLWQEATNPFRLQLFLPGWVFTHAVAINLIDSEGVHRVPFSPDLFTFGHTRLPSPLPETLGFAGFRILTTMNTTLPRDEVIVFQGASYFRAIAKGEVYGLSARGLAVNTGLAQAEEFPSFTEFWLQQPDPSARTVTLYALLDGQHETGAFEFTVQPGESTRTDVTAAIFPRGPVSVLGIAPLSSMFLHDANAKQSLGDFRPEVHDSDGLLIASRSGEWIWRPLVNPDALRVSSFALVNPLGFGLMQRDRNFDHYQDLEARYELRPSAWIMPRGDWGEGEVRLIEIPSHREYDDNIVAMWVPAHVPPLGNPLRASYQIIWGSEDRALPPSPGGRVIATRIGIVHPRNSVLGATARGFVIDFDGDTLNALPATANVEAIVTSGPGGVVIEKHTQKNPVTGGWRASFHVRLTGASPTELRAFLKHGPDTVTETWSYLVQP